MKVGLVTLYNFNYGSVLQCFATQYFFKQKNIECEIIDKCSIKSKFLRYSLVFFNLLKLIAFCPGSFFTILNMVLAQRKSKLNLTIKSLNELQTFLQKNMIIKKYNLRQLKEIGYKKDYICFFTGSDQVWNGYLTNKYDIYFLRFAKQNKRFTLCPSFGGTNVSNFNKYRFKKYLLEFNTITTREMAGYRIIKDLIGRESTVLSDPVLLLSANDWRHLFISLKSKHQNNNRNKRVLLFFIDEPSLLAINQIKSISNNEYLELNSFGYKYNCYNQCNCEKHLDGSPFDFLSLIDSSDLIITDSFHATLFSLLFHVNFYTFSRQYRHSQNQSERITALLSKFKLSSRFDSKSISLNPIKNNYDCILNEERCKLIKYLNEVIDSRLNNDE